MVSRFRVSAYTFPAIIFTIDLLKPVMLFEHNPHHPTLTGPQLKKVVLQLFLLDNRQFHSLLFYKFCKPNVAKKKPKPLIYAVRAII